MSRLAFDVMRLDAARHLVTVRGDICWPDAEDLWLRLDMLIKRGLLLVVDLTAVELADSTALRALLLARRTVVERGAALRLAGPRAQLRGLLARRR